jgi:serine/threonine-protein kinase HipA
MTSQEDAAEASKQPLDLEELKLIPRADVYKAGRLAAHLTRRSDGRIVFAYTKQWRSDGGPAVAFSLPVQAASEGA